MIEQAPAKAGAGREQLATRSVVFVICFYDVAKARLPQRFLPPCSSVGCGEPPKPCLLLSCWSLLNVPYLEKFLLIILGRSELRSLYRSRVLHVKFYILFTCVDNLLISRVV